LNLQSSYDLSSQAPALQEELDAIEEIDHAV